jgi:hypothetical protein
LRHERRTRRSSVVRPRAAGDGDGAGGRLPAYCKLFPHRFGDVVRSEVSGLGGGPIAVKQIEVSTPSIRILLQQALATSEPKVVDVAADEDAATDRFPKTPGGRPLIA